MELKVSWLFDPRVIDTRVGSSAVTPFSPPKGFQGGSVDYMSLLRARYAGQQYQRAFREHVKAFKSDGNSISFLGPFGAEAMNVLTAISLKGQANNKKAS